MDYQERKMALGLQAPGCASHALHVCKIAVSRGSFMTEIGPARRILLFVIALAMVVGGAGLLVFEVFFARHIYVWLAGGAAGLFALGLYLMWEDFLRPLVQHKGP
jgi:hypothetical protein